MGHSLTKLLHMCDRGIKALTEKKEREKKERTRQVFWCTLGRDGAVHKFVAAQARGNSQIRFILVM